MYKRFFPTAPIWFFGALLFTATLFPEEKLFAGAPQWDTASAGQLALRQDGKDVWRFHYGDVTKPFFDPVCVAGGPSLTWARPSDHAWHLGLWFSWKTINGVNYWEENKGQSDGKTRWTAPTLETHADGSATLVLALEYLPGPRKTKGVEPSKVVPVLTEVRTIRFSAPAADGSYFMDWTQVFTAKADVKLDRSAPAFEKGGRPWGGYAGLSIRFAKDFSEVNSIASTKGRFSEKDNGHALGDLAAEQNGLLGGKPYGLAILAHPANPRAPGDWYFIKEEGKRNFYYLNAAVLLTAPLTYAKGETFTLRYRVCVHPGRWDAAQLRTAAGDFAK
ncbi:MAG: PmoA family protein [Puniceicoccales bacterium]|jgi:hypothetical protein|nr:PmoA family protein [Puniceicoccales bacterium]